MPRPTRNLTDQRFGRLIAIEKVNKTGQSQWLCKCDCGNKVIVASNNLIRKNTLSCGCYQKDRVSEAKKIHGDRNTRLYTIWVDMRRRCSYIGDPSYKNYGGRDISVCEEWEKSFLNFKEWALGNGYAENLTIDRVNVDENYCPENCRWATLKQQANNKRDNVYVTVNGETHTLTEWSEITGISYNTITKRRYRGWSDVDAVSTPVNAR